MSLPSLLDLAAADADDHEEAADRALAIPPADKYVGTSLPTPSFTLAGNGPSDSAQWTNPPGVLAPGSMFGVYLVGPCIGEGGMARIYRAEHAGLRRQVALKVLIDGFARDLDGRERFLREARIAAAVKHPNVVNIFDVGVHQDIPYLVMELLEGQDLEKLLQAKGSLDESLIIDIMVPVLAGLLAVHDAGIVHRDLKPGNIFLARGRYNDLEPKLLDFGISTAPGPDQLRLTANRGVMGTPFYISPEGLHGGQMTPLSDQYSLGVVMYECATGGTPYAASAFIELSRLITSGRYIPPSTRKPELSKRLASIIERAMSLQPEHRFKDLREMGRELLSLAGQRTRITWGLSFGDMKDGLALRSGSHSVPPNPGRTRATKRQRRQVALIVSALAPLLVLLVVTFAWVSGRVVIHTTPHPLVASTGAPASGPEARSKVAAAPPSAASDSSGGVPVAAANGSTARVEPASAAPAVDPVEPSSSRPHDTRPPRSTTEPALTRRGARPAAPPARRPAGSLDSEADWALPSASSSANPTRPEQQLGANDSPIFD